jgi:hypothetical protein
MDHVDEASRSPQVRQLLLSALLAERGATGTHRRLQYRITRRLMAGARLNGFSQADLAELLDLRIDTVRDRSKEDGVISAAQFAGLIDAPEAVVTDWALHGLVPPAVTDHFGTTGHLASDLVKALRENYVLSE